MDTNSFKANAKIQNLNCKSHSDSIHYKDAALRATMDFGSSQNPAAFTCCGVHGVSEEWGAVRLSWGNLDLFLQGWSTSASSQWEQADPESRTQPGKHSKSSFIPQGQQRLRKVTMEHN